jgi:hypothetical protein
MSLKQAEMALSEAKDNLNLDKNDLQKASSLEHSINEEINSYPAIGPERHYSEEARRRNL